MRKYHIAQVNVAVAVAEMEAAKEKLDHIRKHGPGPAAFTFGKSFAQP